MIFWPWHIGNSGMKWVSHHLRASDDILDIFFGETMVCSRPKWWQVLCIQIRSAKRNNYDLSWRKLNPGSFFWLSHPIPRLHHKLPSGYVITVCYWKWWFIVDLPIDCMVIFHSYVNVYQRVDPPCCYNFVCSQWFADVQTPTVVGVSILMEHFSQQSWHLQRAAPETQETQGLGVNINESTFVQARNQWIGWKLDGKPCFYPKLKTSCEFYLQPILWTIDMHVHV